VIMCVKLLNRKLRTRSSGVRISQGAPRFQELRGTRKCVRYVNTDFLSVPSGDHAVAERFYKLSAPFRHCSSGQTAGYLIFGKSSTQFLPIEAEPAREPKFVF